MTYLTVLWDPLQSMNQQATIRARIIKERNHLDANTRHQQQVAFNQHLSSFCQRFSSLGIYCAVRGEISVDVLRATDKAIALPKINADDQLVFVEDQADELWEKGAFGIPEPTSKEMATLPEAFIIPLVAIDQWGTRIGMGKGYYDRYLVNLSASIIKIGVGFDCQRVSETIERQAHDVPMDYFISPSGILNFSTK